MFVLMFFEGAKDKGAEVAEGLATVVKHVNYSLGIQVYIFELLRCLFLLFFLRLVEPSDTGVRRFNYLQTFLSFLHSFLNFLLNGQLNGFFMVLVPNMIILLFFLLVLFLSIHIEFVRQFFLLFKLVML